MLKSLIIDHRSTRPRSSIPWGLYLAAPSFSSLPGILGWSRSSPRTNQICCWGVWRCCWLWRSRDDPEGEVRPQGSRSPPGYSPRRMAHTHYDWSLQHNTLFVRDLSYFSGWQPFFNKEKENWELLAKFCAGNAIGKVWEEE